MIIWWLSLAGCWRYPCDELTQTGPCEVTWSSCRVDQVGFETVTLACEEDGDRTSCSCERDGELRATWPEPADTCDRLIAAIDDEERWLQDVAGRQCSIRY